MAARPATTAIVLIHDDDATRADLATCLGAAADLAVAASLRTLAAAAPVLDEQSGALVVLQQHPADERGRIRAVDELRRVDRSLRIVLLVDPIEPGIAAAAIRSGVAGVARADDPLLVDSVRLVAGGMRVFDPAVVAVLAGALDDMVVNPLSSRERQVLQCLAAGLTNAEAAAELYVSRETVKSHVASVLRKLDVDGRLAAVDKAVKIGLLS